jgi:hypothetical protein
MDPDTQQRLDNLTEVVIARHTAHTSLAAAHEKLADEVRRGNLEAVVAKQQEALSKIVSVVYDKAAAYTNVIVIAGYASFFALWSSTKPVLSSRLAISAILSMTVSATAFIAFETFKMIWTAGFLRRYQHLLTDPDLEQFQARLDKYQALHRRHELGFMWIWRCMLIVTIPTALLAVGLLVYNYLLLLLRPGQGDIFL